ncbi:hypothetical protein [Allomesorhizobium camelthorni]|uniref:Twin-arginine translocation signal domain-containing protein n=1 Tax=Allomesorhizobium camelthorni TaxID=475069 RepID=A0A6G4WF13_9HYPH|nr:hypothetical protein [Mesorhizobium camelthorni]NGO52938.1 hypothetical protein [Mesorhizobium camelthorni]
MSGISRRNMLAGTAAIGAAIAGTGTAADLREEKPSRALWTLIETQEAAYAKFMMAIRKPNGSRNDHAAASRDEEKALVAVCGFPAATDTDRRAKATYLLQVEARGELDLREHMQAVLLSMM